MKKSIILILALSVVGINAFASVPKDIDLAFTKVRQYLVTMSKDVESITFSNQRFYSSSDILTHGQLAPGQEAFYVFYGQDASGSNQFQSSGDGFVIVAADDRPSPIIAYSNHGYFDPDNLPDNLRLWLEGYLYESVEVSSDSQRFAKEVDSYVEPFCTTRWGQDKPYNKYCQFFSGRPTPTGCVATALAQAMNVYKYPEHPVGSVDYYTRGRNMQISDNLSNYLFDWSSMRDDYQVGEYTDIEGQAIAELMYVCGLSVQMDYEPYSSGAYFYDVVPGMIDHLGYDHDILLLERNAMTEEEWHQLLMSELEARRPVIYSGAANGDVAHAFLLDGYEIIDGEPYYHINWGWDGSCDGFYRLNGLLPDGSVYDFKLFQECIVNIKPDNGLTEYESLLTAESINVDKTTVDISKKEKIKVTLRRFYNSLYKEFSGEMRFYLIDDKGEYFAGHCFEKNLPFNYGWRNYSFVLSPEYRVPAGEYILEVRTRITNSEVDQRVFCGNGRVKITVVDSSDEEVAIETIESDQIIVSVADGKCSISDLPKGVQVIVYDLTGRLIGKTVSTEEVTEIDLKDSDHIIIQTLGNDMASNRKIVVAK